MKKVRMSGQESICKRDFWNQARGKMSEHIVRLRRK